MTTRVVLERDVPCAMRDGTVLMADVFRPDDKERHPVLLLRTPYDKSFWPFVYAMIDPTKMAAAGYVLVVQDTRGRFASQGVHIPYHGEAEDGVDAIAWASTQPWSDGSVGMYGASYMGQVQWLAAGEQPPALRAIAPATSPEDQWSNLLRRGGALQLGVLASWTLLSIGPNAVARMLADDIPRLMQEFVGLIEDMDNLDDRLQALPLVPFTPIDERAGGFTHFFDMAASAEKPSDVTGQLSSHHLVEQTTVPALQIAGWYDLCLQGDLDHFTAMRARAGSEDARRLTRIIVGPWAHASFAPVTGELDFGFRSSGILLDLREDLTTLHRRWFDARLRGLETGIDDEPPVKLFVMGRNRWRTEDTWPPPAIEQRWHVHSDGSLSERLPQSDAEPSVFVLDPDDPVPTHGGAILMALKHIRGPREQRRIEERDDVLVFTSEVLERELEVIGRLRFSAYVAAETVDTDLVARLCDVHPDGRSYNVADGILRLQFRDSTEHATPYTPGEVVRVEVDLWSTAHAFLPGHRVRLQVCASDFPRYDRCPGTGELSAHAKQVLPQTNRLFHDSLRPSHLVLPVIGR